MTAREEVLARIAAARAGAVAPEVPRDYRTAGAHAPGTAFVIDLLAERLSDYRASVHRCMPDGLADTLRRLLGDETYAVPPGLPHEWLGPESPRTVRDDGRLTSADLDRLDAVVTGCAAACAETGTIALDASPDQGRRMLSLVPDHHICVVLDEQVVHSVPELLACLDPVRPLTFISGPSATSDIELERVEGVHGPRRLDVILVSPDDSSEPQRPLAP